MKVLWICNVILPAIARHLNLEGSCKEGWVSGMADALLENREKNGIELSVAFPFREPKKAARTEEQEAGLCRGTVETGTARIHYYGFYEDMVHPEKYERRTEQMLERIVNMAEPDIVHCFGTEYSHTLCICRVLQGRAGLLVGVQGLCTRIAEAYYADLPEKAVRQATFRDRLRKDSIRQQQEKYAVRGRRERAVIEAAANVTGRTGWDRRNVEGWNPKVRYFHMNENLRSEFYGPVWQEDKCILHSVFLSQGDYPLKGLHYMLTALPEILAVYPDTRVYVAGNSIIQYDTPKQKLKISAYGKYLRRLISQNHLEGKVAFLGMLDAARMRDRYLASHLYVCCSSLENSPNSLGEAMLLGMPCVCADVGGIPGMFEGGKDGILYEGFRIPGEKAAEATDGNGIAGEGGGDVSSLEIIAGRLAQAVLTMWQDPEKRKEYCRNARAHALSTHNREKNYRRLVEIYEQIL